MFPESLTGAGRGGWASGRGKPIPYNVTASGEYFSMFSGLCSW